MHDMTRKMLYITCVPLAFAIDFLITFMGFNMNLILIPLLIGVAVARLSDRGVISDSISVWLKEKLEIAFPDIYETGLLPNGRLLRVTVPMIILIFLNIKIMDYFMG